MYYYFLEILYKETTRELRLLLEKKQEVTVTFIFYPVLGKVKKLLNLVNRKVF